MRRVQQAGSLAFLLFALWVVWEALRLKYWIDLGPGPGFFPFWLGLLLAALCLIWFRQASRLPVGPADAGFFPDRNAVGRMVSILVAIALFLALVDVTGFRLTMLAFLVFLLTVVGRQKALVTTVFSLAGSFGIFYVFTDHLSVHLPVASVEFLQSLGL